MKLNNETDLQPCIDRKIERGEGQPYGALWGAFDHIFAERVHRDHSEIRWHDQVPVIVRDFKATIWNQHRTSDPFPSHLNIHVLLLWWGGVFSSIKFAIMITHMCDPSIDGSEHRLFIYASPDSYGFKLS